MLARAHQTINYRDLLYNLVVRDLKVRYKHSFLGFFWSLLNPLLLIGGIHLRIQYAPRQSSQTSLPDLFLCALLPWNWCAASVTGTLGSIVNSGYLIKKVYFPEEMLPLAVVLSNMVNFVLSMPALLIFMLFLKPEFTIHILWWPALVFIQALFLTGLGFFLAALNVFFRDTSVLVAGWPQRVVLPHADNLRCRRCCSRIRQLDVSFEPHGLNSCYL